MPLPKPGKKEDQDTFHSRCMGDAEAAKNFPDQKQRNAICYNQWNRHKKGHKAEMMDTTACWANHLGMWSIEPLFFTQAFELFRLGLFTPPDYTFYSERFSRAWQHEDVSEDETSIKAYSEEERKPYLVQDQIAVIPIDGPLTKARSKFGGASTLDIQRATRAAVRDDTVKGLFYAVDSPGGHVAGIQALADDIAAAGMKKPTRAHIEDLGASAAYWLASQTHHITANKTAEVGSIGTMAVITDDSQRLDRLGVKVHLLSTGPYKGIGAPGTPIDKEALEYLQSRVNEINAHFLASMQRGRQRMTQEQLHAAADGRVFIAQIAQQMGLIDGVKSFDAAFEDFANANHTAVLRSRQTAHAEALMAKYHLTIEG